MIFQESLGIDIQDRSVTIAHLKRTLRGAKLIHHARYALGTEEGNEARLQSIRQFLIDFMKEYHISSPSIFLALGEKRTISKQIELPAIVKEDLRTTLTYELEKHVPVPENEVHFDYHLLAEDREKLTLLLVVIKKKDLQPYLDVARAVPGGCSGIEIDRTAAANWLAYGGNGGGKDRLTTWLQKGYDAEAMGSDSFKMPLPSMDLAPAVGAGIKGMGEPTVDINLLPEAFRKKPSRIGRYLFLVLTGITILALLALVGGHLVKQRMAINTIDARIAQLRGTVDAYDRLQERKQVLETRMDYLESVVGRRVSVLEVVAELTRTVPETAWVRDLKIDEKGVEIEGNAESASELIALIESSPLFSDAVFLSTITKERDGMEKFRIGFKLET